MNKKAVIIIIAVIISLVLLLFLIKQGKINLRLNIGAGRPVSALLAQANESLRKGDLLSARDAFQKLINEFPQSSQAMSWQKKAEELNIKLLFSPAVTPKSTLYEIRPGDTLTKIAREFKTTTDLLMKSNNLSSDKIVPGRKIKVWNAPFNIFVDKSQNILILKSDEDIIKTYVVSTGNNNSTPAGNFKIVDKLVDPTWFKAGAVVAPGSPENILGSRWMGINVPGYGIHGTTDPQTLGQQVTQGCVRMSNAEVEELYVIVPVGTEVTIVD